MDQARPLRVQQLFECPFLRILTSSDSLSRALVASLTHCEPPCLSPSSLVPLWSLLDVEILPLLFMSIKEALHGSFQFSHSRGIFFCLGFQHLQFIIHGVGTNRLPNFFPFLEQLLHDRSCLRASSPSSCLRVSLDGWHKSHARQQCFDQGAIPFRQHLLPPFKDSAGLRRGKSYLSLQLWSATSIGLLISTLPFTPLLFTNLTSPKSTYTLNSIPLVITRFTALSVTDQKPLWEDSLISQNVGRVQGCDKLGGVF